MCFILKHMNVSYHVSLKLDSAGTQYPAFEAIRRKGRCLVAAPRHASQGAAYFHGSSQGLARRKFGQEDPRTKSITALKTPRKRAMEKSQAMTIPHTNPCNNTINQKMV